MSAPPSTSPTSILGLALTLDPAAAALPSTIAALHARPGLVLGEVQLPFAAVALETDDPRGDHSWLESLPGVVAVDVAFVEVLSETESPAATGQRRRRSRDPIDDSPLPATGPVTETDPDFPSL